MICLELFHQMAALDYLEEYIIFYIAVLIPTLAVSVRRLHDIGKSGWYYLIGLVPIVGSLILLVWFCTEGERNSNGWGEDPKMGEA